MKAERPGGEPEAARGEPASPQVAHDDPAARYPVELAKHRLDLALLEVMEQLGTCDDVDARRREWQSARVAAQTAVECRLGRARERFRRVEAEHGEGEASSASLLARLARDVGHS